MADPSKNRAGRDGTVACMSPSLDVHSTGLPALDAGDDLVRARRAEVWVR